MHFLMYRISTGSDVNEAEVVYIWMPKANLQSFDVFFLVPSVAPHIIDAHNTSQSSIHFQWNLTYGWDGEPWAFVINWDSYQVFVCPNQTSYNITDLQPFTVYSITIRGATGVGIGKSVVFNVSTDEGGTFEAKQSNKMRRSEPNRKWKISKKTWKHGGKGH